MPPEGRSRSSDGAVADHLRQTAVAELNAEIRALGRRFLPFAGFDWGFWCECGDECCHEHVVISHRQFDELRRLGDPLLADGHPVERARELRQQARGLRAETVALRAQAGQQARRARRLRGG